MANVGFATLSVIPSLRGAQAAMSGQMAGPSSAVGKQAGGAMGAALKVGLGGALAGIGAVVGLAKLGGSFDEAFDTIRVGTGATGEAMDGLKDSFKTVFSSVPTDMGLASTAIADLNTRLGLTGEPLEELSKQLLEVSRITGTDLTANIASVSRVFGDWGVDTDRQSAALDALFRASQASGATVQQLSEGLVKFGSPLRQLGFSMGKSTALLGAFEQQGVNSELVMGSLRIALGKMARAGEKDLPAALNKSIEAIKNAETAGEGAALALELFGARAGPDMAAAIREGRFELGAIYDAIGEGNETVLGAAADTASFSEKWNVFKNQVLVALEPIATRVFTFLGDAMDGLSSWWVTNGPAVIAGFENVKAAVTAFVDDALVVMKAWWDDNGPLVIASVIALKEGVELAFAGLIKAGEFVIEHWDQFKYVAGVMAVAVIGHYVKLAIQATISAATQVAAWASTKAAAIAAGIVHTAQVGIMIAGWVLLAIRAGVQAAIVVASWVLTSVAARGATTAHGVAVAAQIAGWGTLSAASARHAGLVAASWVRALGPMAAVIAGAEAINNLTGNKLNPNDLNLWERLDPRKAFRGLEFDIPFFAGGGVMPGQRGVHNLAWVAGGETVLPTHKQDFSASSSVEGLVVMLDGVAVGNVVRKEGDYYHRRNG